MRIATFFVALSISACSVSSRPDADARPGEPWALQTVRPDTTDGIRILVLHDMEGLSGQSDPNTFFFGQPEYPKGQELLAADVNAVIAGLFDGGATEVQVVDGHGSGNPQPDVRRDLLDPRATQIIRDQDFDAYFDLVAPRAFDAVAVVGMHAKTGSRGFASHTITLGIGVLINGREITETELVALSWGRQDIPVIFGSGDDRLAADLAHLPWIEFVTVKTATAADSAAPRPVDEARADLRAGAKRAAENLRQGKAQAMIIRSTLVAGLKAVPPASLAMLAGIPGIRYADSVVTFSADSLRHAYDVIEALVGVARANYASVLRRVVGGHERRAEIMSSYSKGLIGTWFDYESGRWKPAPAAGPAGQPVPGQHHGYR